MEFPTSGLYAITQTENKSCDTVLQEVSLALKSGVSVVQYRDKNPTDSVYLAKELLLRCKQYKVPLLINDSADLAEQIGADGVHLGKDDGNIVGIRKQLGYKAIIGISCYNNLPNAIKAQDDGADYVAFGRFFPSSSKPLASPAQIETLREAKNKIQIPIVAIGGILPSNGGSLLKAGADILAVIDGIFSHNPEQSTKAYLNLFSK
ncbi:MAG: thiamine phosphate synthase [Methylococcaceae bacterium]|nr:thiamine phosphate synthase [Methylococcaceae bacterium]